MGGLNIGILNGGGRQIESRDQVMAVCGPSMHSNHSKLSDITTSKLSVKSQFVTHTFNKAMATEWCQLFTCGQGKAAEKADASFLKEIQKAE